MWNYLKIYTNVVASVAYVELSNSVKKKKRKTCLRNITQDGTLLYLNISMALI